MGHVMKPRHQVSRAGIELIKRFEGYRPRAARLDDGRWTVGYGHLRSAREGAEPNPKEEVVLQAGKRLAVFSIRESKGGSIWVRAGSAFVNKDGSLNVLLDVLPLDGKLHVREAGDKREGLGTNARAGMELPVESLTAEVRS